MKPFQYWILSHWNERFDSCKCHLAVYPRFLVAALAIILDVSCWFWSLFFMWRDQINKITQSTSGKTRCNELRGHEIPCKIISFYYSLKRLQKVKRLNWWHLSPWCISAMHYLCVYGPIQVLPTCRKINESIGSQMEWGGVCRFSGIVQELWSDLISH